ncbi:MAG: phenylacetate-CoA oxygenase subunit PaaJ [Phycisphaerae bacterium]
MMTRDDVLGVLRTVDDPEMPISIVDLGLVERVEVRAAGALNSGPSALAEVQDVVIELLPTFVGCHALPMIERNVRDAVSRLSGAGSVEVRFRFDPPWSPDRISEAGREALRQFGVTVPVRAGQGASCAERPVSLSLPRPEACPVCGSTNVRLESAFGPTRCRMIYHCEDCRNPFEHIKRLD